MKSIGRNKLKQFLCLVNRLESVTEKLSQRRFVHNVTADAVKKEVHEVTIPVPWGYVAGKWWGDKNSQIRPILAIHGWQDNAGSFDPLIERMDLTRPVLAIDMPGHGWSSHLYPSMVYHDIDSVLLVRRIQSHYGWDKVSFLTHSIGGVTSFLFGSLYPEFTDFIINFDLLKPLDDDLKRRADEMGSLIDRIINLTKRVPSQEGWPLEELTDRWLKGSGNSVTRESAKILMKRGIKEVKPNRFIFARDFRLKAQQLQRFEACDCLRLAKNMMCPVLLIRASNSPVWEMTTRQCPEVMKTLEENLKYFKIVTVEGTHHFHLNDPEPVVPFINSFLNKIKQFEK